MLSPRALLVLVLLLLLLLLLLLRGTRVGERWSMLSPVLPSNQGQTQTSAVSLGRALTQAQGVRLFWSKSWLCHLL